MDSDKHNIPSNFDCKNAGLQSKLIDVRNTSNEIVDTIEQYVKEALEKSVLFFES